MTPFKNHNSAGFMLTEVLLALAIIGIALTPIFGLQSTMMRAIARISAQVTRFFVADDFLVQSQTDFMRQEKTELKRDQQHQDPTTSLAYLAKPIKEDPAFKHYPGIIQQELEYVWQEGTTQQRERLVSLVYKAQEKKEATP